MLTNQVSLTELVHDPRAVFRYIITADKPVLVMEDSKPTVVVISLADYEFLEQARCQQTTHVLQTVQTWTERAQQLREAITRRAGALLPDSVAELDELREEHADGNSGLY